MNELCVFQKNRQYIIHLFRFIVRNSNACKLYTLEHTKIIEY